MTEKTDEMGEDFVGKEETLDSQDSMDEAGSWQDELPPEDDFHDEGESLGDVVEQFGEDVPVDSAVLAQEEARKRGKKVLIVGGVLAACFVGALVYLQFNGGSNRSGPLPVAQVINFNELKEMKQAVAQAEASPSGYSVSSEDSSAEEAAAQSPKGQKEDIADLYDESSSSSGSSEKTTESGGKEGVVKEKTATPVLSGMLTSSPQPAPAAASVAQPESTPVPPQETVSIPEPKAPIAPKQEKSAAMEVFENALPQVAKVETIPVPAPPSKPEVKEKPVLPSFAQEAVVPKVTTEAPVATPPLPKAGTVAVSLGQKVQEDSGKVQALASQVEDLQGALQRMEQQNAKLLDKIESLQRLSSPKKEEPSSKGLEKKVAQLEGELAKLRKKEAKQAAVAPAPSSGILAVAPVGPRMSGLDVNAMMPKEGAAPLETLAPPQSEEKQTLPAVPAEKKETPKTRPALTNWTLRAAMPEAAWVSLGKNATDLRRVVVGDVLPGLGKVKEIQKEGRGWALVAENGVLR